MAQSVTEAGGRLINDRSTPEGHPVDAERHSDGTDSGISKDDRANESTDDSDSDTDSAYSIENEMVADIKVSNKTGDFEIAPRGPFLTNLFLVSIS